MQENSQGSMGKAITGFSGALAATGAILLSPLIARHVRVPVQGFLSSELDYQTAYWGSWAVVILLAASSYFGSSAVLQLLVQLLFRRTVKIHRSPF
ncbi:hypothetical protein [Oceanobacter antarcticus]|uniref:Uncharacterized protein n=1 Tax=Oceanobacter antarcticus TaxID=3133425 RepID=A0ABW8NDR6_9GAMM